MTCFPEIRRSAALAGALVALFVLQSATASLFKSPAFDEPIHLTAGLSYLETRDIVVNREHPPLMKELAGLGLLVGGIRWPATPEARALANGDLRHGTAVANRLIVEEGPDRVMFWARLPMILVAGLLAVAVFLLGRQLVGEAAALGALFLLAFDPNVLAHSYLVTTDVGVTAFTILYLLALWSYLARPAFLRILWCGLALGAALGAKFSAVVLFPITAVLLVAAAVWPIEGGTPDGKGAERGVSGRLLQYALAFVYLSLVAFAVVQAVYLFPRNPFEYVASLGTVYGNADPDFLAYMAGELRSQFYSYYAVAYLLKEPLATLVLVAAGAGMLVRARGIAPLARIFVILPASAFFLGYSLFSVNIGIRYILPVLPFAFMLGGTALAALFESGRRTLQVSASLLCAWIITAAAGIYPDHLSYFNEAACLLDEPRHVGLDGGSRCGPSWLDDSNVDWGQGLEQLARWLDENAEGRTVRLGQFGLFPPDAYGIQYRAMGDDDLLTGSAPGLYAVSSHIVASTPALAQEVYGGGAEWLRSTPPEAIVGHAFYIFEIPEP